MEEQRGTPQRVLGEELVEQLTVLAANAVAEAEARPDPFRSPALLLERIERDRRGRAGSTAIVIAVFVLLISVFLFAGVRSFVAGLPHVSRTPDGLVSVSIDGFPCAGGFPLLLAVALGGMLYLWLRRGNSGKALAALGAMPVSRESLPVTAEAVEEMALAFGLRRRPDLYLIESPALNAFIAGGAPDTAGIAVTRGLAEAMPVAEQRAVVAHLLARMQLGRVATSEAEASAEEQADALAMQTLREPAALLAALERTRSADTTVLTRGWVTSGFFFAEPMPLTTMNDYVCSRRIARLRAVLGAEGATP